MGARSGDVGLAPAGDRAFLMRLHQVRVAEGF
jgi:hypothetical protein